MQLRLGLARSGPVLDPAARRLLFCQIKDPAPLPLRLVKDATGRTVRISF